MKREQAEVAAEIQRMDNLLQALSEQAKSFQRTIEATRLKVAECKRQSSPVTVKPVEIRRCT